VSRVRFHFAFTLNAVQRHGPAHTLFTLTVRSRGKTGPQHHWRKSIMKKTIRNHPRSLLAVALSATLLFSAGQSMAQANEPEEKSTEAVNGSAQPVNDTWITTKVKADLLATENVSGLDIKVETVNGVVTLSGAVANKAQKDKAVEVATKIKGVTRVDSSGLTLASR
jgi:hyperosmotically inducible protein